MNNHPALYSNGEAERLASLREYGILDTDHEQAFDDLTALASYICGTPVSAISLVDAERQWFKSSVGLTDRETPRDISFCQHTILEEEILIVPDATKDDRFKNSPLVTDGLKLQFYAGVPLITPDGSAIGALCVNDNKPRALSDEQLDALKRLARQVVGQLELRRKNIYLEQQAADLLAANCKALQAKAEANTAMEEMRIGDERFRLVCKATEDVVWDVDIATGRIWLSEDHPSVLAANTTIDNPTIDDWIDNIHPEDRERVKESFRDAISKGESSLQSEYRLTRIDGQYVDVLSRAFLLLGDDGKPVRIIGAVTDLTERKQAERDRLDRENSDRANQAKSEFLSRMSHELRTPLNSILGFAQLLEMYDPTEKQKHCVHRILTGGKHLLGLINEVLDISRIESGSMEISLEAVRVENVVDEAIALTQSLASSYDVSVSKSHASDHHIFARADRQRLLQIVINLISNAVKYNVEGGSVVLEVSSQLEGIASIAVKDTGRGISKDVAHRVFRPFDRLGLEQEAKIEGTGLGLALSKSLVDAMQGQIYFRSNVGNGTTFTVQLQRMEEPALMTNDQIALAGTPVTTDIRVLYIEDNESNIALMDNIVRSNTNWSLEIAMTGAEGLDAAQKNPPDLVLLDLDLPDMPGREVLMRLLAMRSCIRIPVLIISADATQERVDRLLTAGAAGYITKPFDVRNLLREVYSHLPGAHLAA